MNTMTANIILPDNVGKLPDTSDCAGKSCTDNGAIWDVSANAILADLNRVKCEFQLRTICTVMGMKP